jgi:hypothetical protein
MLSHCQAAGVIDDKRRCALWSLHSSGAIVSLERAQERVDVSMGSSYRSSGAGDDMLMLMLVPGLLLLAARANELCRRYKATPYLYVDEPLQVEASRRWHDREV